MHRTVILTIITKFYAAESRSFRWFKANYDSLFYNKTVKTWEI